MTESELAQLNQTIEMFEVITQSQPHDYQSLEILKEAYLKLGRDQEAIGTSRRIAEAYVDLGQLSSAILEYETILQRFPEDEEVRKALTQIETRANAVNSMPAGDDQDGVGAGSNGDGAEAAEFSGHFDDGRETARKLFVDGKHIGETDFDLCWPEVTPKHPGTAVVEPFVYHLDDKKMMSWDKSLKLLSEKARAAYLPIENYDINIEVARSFPSAICRRWCILPLDVLGRTTLVATVNPFNSQAAKELQAVRKGRVLWYLVSPHELMREIKKIHR